MKIKDIYESTTSGSIATVETAMTTQKRNNVGKGVYGNEKAGNLLTGKKTNKKYANSISESKMKQVAMDLDTMQDGNFKQKYGKTKQQIKMLLGDPESKKTIHESPLPGFERYKVVYFDPKKDRNVTIKVDAKTKENAWDYCAKRNLEVVSLEKMPSRGKQNNLDEATLEEDDLILVPGQGHRLKTGFHAFDPDKAEHEGETLKNSLRTIVRNAKELHDRLENSDQFPEWVSEKIGTIKGMMTAVTEYLISKQEPAESAGVIAGGGVGEGLEHGDHEISMAKSEMRSAAKSAKRIYDMLNQRDELMAWQQSYITLASDYLDSVADAMEEESHSELDEEGKGLWANIHAKRERIKHGSGERMRKPGSKGAPSAQDFKDAAKEGVGEKIKGVIRREKAKDLPVLQTRRDYAMGKAGDAYNKGEIRKGNQYSAYAEKDRKKKGDPTTNPAGTYRTKTSDYTNEGALVDNLYKVRYKNTETGETKDIKIRAPSSKEAREQAESDYTHDSRVWKCLGTKEITNEAQSMGTALKNTLAKAEPGSKLDNSIKAHNRDVKNGGKGTLKNAPTGYHFDSKGYCRLGDK